jgi:hypothetical protein
VTFLLCKRSKLTSCGIPYEGVPLAVLLETIILDMLLSDLAKSSSTFKAAFWVVGVRRCVWRLDSPYGLGNPLRSLSHWISASSFEERGTFQKS